MKNLIYKDFKIAVHPVIIVYYVLAAAMMLIPSYPKFIGALYILVGIFTMFRLDLTYKDREFCGMLPVSKAETVKARIYVIILLELIEIAACIFGAVICKLVMPAEFTLNVSGMNTNLIILSTIFIAYGLANIIIIPGGYRKRFAVQARFLIAVFVFCIIGSASEVIASSLKIDFLLSDSASALLMQLPILLASMAIYAVLNIITYRITIKAYERTDI